MKSNAEKASIETEKNLVIMILKSQSNASNLNDISNR